ncbi:AAEL017112-PA [Aedes aegypti]|uniref:AAEL017112-PA n=1 Tax=Aedes aegypti TaxID=7159 RepID=J9HFN8_AEDAE|nr:AAEL017112-PA [Aedes aegypti]
MHLWCIPKHPSSNLIISGYPFGSRSVNLSKSGIQLNNYKSSAVNLIGDDKAFLECMCV